MISHKHKCIFVHVPKVAGISLEQIFLEDLELTFENRMPLLLGVSTNQTLGPPRISHLVAKEYVSQHYICQRLYDDYFKFGFVRNPYKRVFSFYKYLGYNKIISFEKFVVKYLPLLLSDLDLYYFMQPMYNYLHIDGQLAVDKVGKLESINEDVNFIFENTTIEKREIPHANQSESLSFKAHIKLVSRIFKKFPSIIFNYNFSKKKTKYYLNDSIKHTIVKLYNVDFETFNYDKD